MNATYIQFVFVVFINLVSSLQLLNLSAAGSNFTPYLRFATLPGGVVLVVLLDVVVTHGWYSGSNWKVLLSHRWSKSNREHCNISYTATCPQRKITGIKRCILSFTLKHQIFNALFARSKLTMISLIKMFGHVLCDLCTMYHCSFFQPGLYRMCREVYCRELHSTVHQSQMGAGHGKLNFNSGRHMPGTNHNSRYLPNPILEGISLVTSTTSNSLQLDLEIAATPTPSCNSHIYLDYRAERTTFTPGRHMP